MSDRGEDIPRPRVAVVVLGCRLPSFDRLVRISRRTWASVEVPGIDIVYAYGNGCRDHELVDLTTPDGTVVPTVPDMEVSQVGDLLLCGCSDLIAHQTDALLRKRLLAFEHLVRGGEHDLVYTVCASSYVDQAALADYVAAMDTTMAFHGAAAVCRDTGGSYISGSSMLVSVDLAGRLVDARDDLLSANAYAYADDVAIGGWVRANVDMTNAFVTDLAHGLLNYRGWPREDHEPVEAAYHYHFDAARAGDLEAFHARLRSWRRGADPDPPAPPRPRPRADDNDQVFVQIPAYRDPELPRTIAHALEQAERPDRLHFGICSQYDEVTAADLDPWRDDARFRLDRVPYEESQGCCWARSRINGLYDGERYTLQIDAHSRFAEGWDRRFVGMLEGIDADLPLLTTYPPGYVTGPDGADELDDGAGVQRLVLERLRPDLTTRQSGEVVDDLRAPGPSRFLGAGLIFTFGRFCTDVPYDPHLYFHGEEISLAVRAYTHGYDLHHPNENLVWHLYDHGAPLHWTDHAEARTSSRRQTRERLHALLVGDPSELGPHGPGPVRMVADYEDYAHVDFGSAGRTGSVRRPVRFRRFVALDTEPIEPRDDYRRWVFTLMTDHDVELHRRDLTEPKLLSGRTRVLWVDVNLPDTPTRYLLWPQSDDGWGPRVVRPLPELTT